MSMSYTNKPLSTRRKNNKKIKNKKGKKKKERKKKMSRSYNDNSRCCIRFQFVVCAYDSAAIHLGYLKACDEWVAHKIVLCLSSLWQLAVKVTKQNYIGPKGWLWWIPDTIELGIFCIPSDKEGLLGLTGRTCVLWQMKR